MRGRRTGPPPTSTCPTPAALPGVPPQPAPDPLRRRQHEGADVAVPFRVVRVVVVAVRGLGGEPAPHLLAPRRLVVDVAEEEGGRRVVGLAEPLDGGGRVEREKPRRERGDGV